MIYLISGKGGVGKSLVTAALAKSLADRGRSVLAVELGEARFLHQLYGVSESFESSLTTHKFALALWDGASCLREYFLHLLKIQRMVDLFFDNRITHALVEGAPGLKELALTGKITSGIRKIGPILPFDDVVVDGYSTGHFKALIKAPLAMSEAIAIGPMGDQSRMIDRVLKSDQVQYVVVTNPEELALSEGQELRKFLNQEFSERVWMVGNRWWPVSTTALESSLPESFQEKIRHVLTQQQRPVDLQLPQLWETNNLRKIETLSSKWGSLK